MATQAWKEIAAGYLQISGVSDRAELQYIISIVGRIHG